MKRLVALAAVLAVAAAASGADSARYRNPTAGAVLTLQLPGMHRAQVRRDVVYRRVGGVRLRLDVYHPRTSQRRRLPAVLLGGPPAFRAGKDSGQKVGWAQAIAASGLAAVAFDTRPDRLLSTPAQPASDVAAAIAYVRSHARALRVDGDRLCTLGFSIGTAPWHLWATMRDPQPFMRCNVVFYGPLDFRELAPQFGMSAGDAEEYAPLTHLRRQGARVPPMLVVRAGREGNVSINESIARFVEEAERVGADVRVATHETGGHGFDVGAPGARSRALIREALGYLRDRLAPARALAARRPAPLRLEQRCVTKHERRRVIRFEASDGVRLIGVMFGAGPRGVVLAHQGGGGAPGNLCAWVPYARVLAGLGYRVLAFDHRGRGSSAQARTTDALQRVNRDVVGAVRVIRARGARSVVLGGASLGGVAVLTAATAIQPPVQGVISFSAPQTFVRLDGVREVAKLTVPVLYVAMTGDEPFADDARALYEATASADKQIRIWDGPHHGAPMLREPEVRSAVDAWIAGHSP